MSPVARGVEVAFGWIVGDNYIGTIGNFAVPEGCFYPTGIGELPGPVFRSPWCAVDRDIAAVDGEGD